jgi:hypothetical protein
VTFASWLPWLLIALLSGALVDSWDRRRVLWTVDLGRCVLVGALLGGVLGRTLGLRAPFVFGAVILAAMALLALPAVNTRSVEAARIQATAASACD